MDGTVRSAPGVVFFAVRLATALLQVGRPRDALAVVTRMLGSGYPEREMLFGLQAVALQRLGRYPGALEAARKAEALNPRDPSLRRLREECERRAGSPRRR
jgi:Flp pilus assembly protein TadD